ncbi:MAG: Mu transposase C-terminal domain-containing protein [Mycobacteriales bacterium]
MPLVAVAERAGVPLRTMQRWLGQYRADGLVGLARRPRSDRGCRTFPPELVTVIEGLALHRPARSIATVTRQAGRVAADQGWPIPSYSSVRTIVAGLDPAMTTLAHDGPTTLRDKYELVYRRRAEHPNAMWQADHTELDLLILDEHGTPVRPWLSIVLDDHSRAVAGCNAFLGAPSALNTSLTLRQAIWRKPDPAAWPVSGIPDVLYVDHGSDFISHHLTWVAIDLHVQLIHSAVGRPQGRGKIERLFGTITTELMPQLPGQLVHGRPTSPPRLTLTELDQALTRWVVEDYHRRVHPETGQPPHAAWLGQGWLPRMPDTLEDLDLLLVMVATPRTVHRDGIRFQGLRYLAPTLAPYVGDKVTIRYDPRDLGEIRVFHRDRFLCRAISDAHAGEHLTLADIKTARTARRRDLRAGLNTRVAAADQYSRTELSATPPARRSRSNRKLAVYLEDKT